MTAIYARVAAWRRGRAAAFLEADMAPDLQHADHDVVLALSTQAPAQLARRDLVLGGRSRPEVKTVLHVRYSSGMNLQWRRNSPMMMMSSFGPAAEVLLIASGQMSAGFVPIGRLDDLAHAAFSAA